MKIALVSLNDSADIHQWSGLNYFIARSLERAGATVYRVGPFKARWTNMMRLRQRWYDATGRTYHAIIEPSALESIGAQARAQIPADADAVLSITSLMAAALGPLDIPLASWDDATNAAMQDYYPDFRRMPRISRRHSAAFGQRAADAVSLAIYTSTWAANSARDAYGLPTERMAIIPFGANLERLPGELDVMASLAARDTTTCHLLWIGVDWERKGGPLTLEIARGLRAAGVNAELTIAGCDPPIDAPDWVHLEGFISKRDPAGEARLAALFAQSHFFVMPSLAEAFGLVYVEAAAFGVPSVAFRTGGVESVIVNNMTGIMEEPSARAEAFVSRIATVFRNASRYESMAWTAYHRSCNTLNWYVSGKRVVSILSDLSNRAKSQ